MRNDASMQELFPEPNPFTMDRSLRRYRRDAYVGHGKGSARKRCRLRPNTIVALGIVVLLVLAFGITAANANLESGMADALWAKGGAASASATQATNAPQSTPVSEWKRGSVPMLYQTDPVWANRKYAGATIETHGCGPTCLSMVYVALTGKTDLDPKGMADFSTRCGYVDGSETAWALMSEGAAQLGLNPREIPRDASALKEAVAAGSPLVLSMGKGDFTTDGHFIVVCGVDDNGDLIVRDPNSAERSNKAWDPETVLGQCLNIWAFSA